MNEIVLERIKEDFFFFYLVYIFPRQPDFHEHDIYHVNAPVNEGIWMLNL